MHTQVQPIRRTAGVLREINLNDTAPHGKNSNSVVGEHGWEFN